MSSKKFFEQLKDGQEPSLMETIREAASAIREAAGQVWDGAKPMFDHGRTEAAAALFHGATGHVMYMHGQEGIEQGQDQVQGREAMQPPEVERDTGREL